MARKSKPMKQTIVDSVPVKLQLIEGEEGGKVKVRGEFGKADIPTQNGRVYPKKIWESQITRLGRAMKNRRVFGEADHPVEGKTSLNRVSHIVTDLRLEDGIVIGEAELMDTDRGRNLKALLKAGCTVGVSSRGFGSVKPDDKGNDVVQEDFQLATFDFVADPADQDAYPEPMFEGCEIPSEQLLSEEDSFESKIEAAKKEEREKLTKELKNVFSEELKNEAEKLRSEVAEEVRAELLTDPEVAGAKTALESIKAVLKPYVLSEDTKALVEAKEVEITSLKEAIDQKNQEVARLQEEVTKANETAKEFGYRYYFETEIAGNPDAEIIRALVGEITKYDSLDSLKKVVSTVAGKLSEHRAAQEEKLAIVERKREEWESALVDRLEKMEEALAKSLELNKELSLKVYADNKLTNNPKRQKIQSVIESTKVNSETGVDTIVEQFREPAKTVEELDEVRARIRALTQGGKEVTPIEEETKPEGKNDLSHLGLEGMSRDALRALIGVK